MKLANQTIIYLSLPILLIIGIWSTVFYFNILNEIKDSVDEGLENYKRQIIHKVNSDTSLLSKSNFDESFFSIIEIGEPYAITFKDRYIDTTMFMQDADDPTPEPEPTRMLTTVFNLNEKYYKLKIINSMVEEDDLIRELLMKATWLYLILVASIVFINNFILKKLWYPFYSLLHQLKNYRLGSNNNFPKVKTKTKEFKDLQSAVNILLSHNIENYEQQKQFIGNASHELQTPLAIAISKLELLIEKGQLENSQAESIGEIMTIIERLIRLNKSLLLLTKIENKQFLNNQNISLNEIFHQNISDLEELTTYKKIDIQLNESSSITINMDPSLANIVVSNLLRNAIFHNVKGGIIQIDISSTEITVRNSGIKKPLNTEKIFNRFHKSESGNSGSGLGLAIVKAIGVLYDFNTSYYFEKDLHNFKITLPQTRK